jgi:hypothetical protein
MNQKRPPYWSELGKGDGGAIPRQSYGWSYGPRIYGSGQAGQFKNRWLFYGDWLSGGIRMINFGTDLEDIEQNRTLTGVGIGANTGSISELYETGFYKTISGALLGTGKEIIAVTKQNLTCEISWFNGLTIERVEFAGVSPLVYWTGAITPVTSSQDGVVLYTNSAGDKILARFERDSFATEYEIHAAVAPAIGELHHIDRQALAMRIWGRSKNGEMLVFESPDYPAFPPTIEDSVTLEIDVYGTTWFAIIASPAQADALDFAVSVDGTASRYYLPIVSVPAQSDALDFAVQLAPSFNTLVVIAAAGQADALDFSVSIGASSNTEVIQATPTKSDAIDMSVTISSSSSYYIP